MSAEENKALVRHFIEEVYNERNVDALDQMLTPDYAEHDEPPTSPLLHGPEILKRTVPQIFGAFPNIRYEVEDMISEGEKVVTHWTARGAQRGEFMGVAPTDREVRFSGITIYQIANGKIAQTWAVWDALGLFEQIGLIPTLE
jgi:steroid delta-isomerase-like uncharacterized protein